MSIEQKNKGAQQNECNNKIDRQRQGEKDRDRQRQTETDRDRQRQTETDRDRQRQTETERDGHIVGHRQREKVIINGKFNFESRDWACLQPKVLLIRMGNYQNFFSKKSHQIIFFKH